MQAPPLKRFWSKVSISGGPQSCWEWKAAKDKDGYGVTSFNKKWIGAHRLAWILAKGEIPDGLCVCHHCDNPSCVNPSHLFLGTVKDNTQDMIRKGRSCVWTRPECVVRGSVHSSAKLTEDDVREMRRKYAMNESNQTELSREYGVSSGRVSEIITLKSWTHVQQEGLF